MVSPPLEADAKTHSLAELRREIKAAGLGEPAAARIYAKFLALVGVSLALLVGIVRESPPWWVAIPAAGLSAWLLTSAAMCGHDGAHGAASARAWVNDLLAWLAFALLGGLSVNYWKQKHNVLHHPFVNIARKDPDVQQSPLAMSSRQHEEHGGSVRFLQRHVQVAAFWILGAPLVAVALRVASLRYLVHEIQHGRRLRSNLVDLAWTLGHYPLWLLLPLAVSDWKTVLLVYAIATPLMGLFLAFIFAPAHMPYPLVAESSDPLLLQLSSTRNFRTLWFFRFTLIGLDHQIEHHVAQTLHHFDLARAAPIVRDYCARHGLPYNETGWLRALLDTSRQIHRGWRLAEIVVNGGSAPE